MAHGGREMLSVCRMPGDVGASGILRPAGRQKLIDAQQLRSAQEQLRQQWLRDIVGIDLIAGEQ